MTHRDALSAYLLWFLEQRDVFWFDAEETGPGPTQPSKSAVVIPFRRRSWPRDGPSAFGS
jgi:hypothetical protein